MTAPVSRGGPRDARVDVFLKPGEWFVGDASHRIRTVLGSCVSVTLWSPSLRVGAMSHFLLATRAGVRPPASVTGLDLRKLDARYGDEALRLMLHELARREVAPATCEAKIFGGGNMFPEQCKAAIGPAVGRRNGEAAREMLLAQGIAVVSESLFGDGHRQVAFDIDTGDIWARQLAPAPAAALAARQQGIEHE
jgi:chemotaxis protein CheD